MSASITVSHQYPVSKLDNRVPFQKCQLNSSSATSFLGFGFTHLKASSLTLSTTAKTRTARLRPGILNPVLASSLQSFDVVVVGGGIIGLTIARQFLTGSDLSVAVVDKSLPCSGIDGAATGAGQGYIWMVHNTPGTDVWELSSRSRKLWDMFIEGIRETGSDPSDVIGWKKTGSLLIGRTFKESTALKERVKKLDEAGMRADYLSQKDLLLKEPALLTGEESGAAFLPDDYQIDAQSTVAFIQKANRSLNGRYVEFFNDPVISLLRSGHGGKIEGVQTSKNTLYSKAIIFAAGCWSGSLVPNLFRDYDIDLDIPVKPRKGHLLIIENFNSLQLNHAIMEVGYADHITSNPSSSALGSLDDEQILSISMTATTDTMGNLILGSSRQFAEFNTEVDESIISLIWQRAGEFIPQLKEMPLSNFRRNRQVRVGLRPHMPAGKPVIGPVPGLPNVFLATGHEGGGIRMALGTAEMVANMVLGNPTKLDSSRFSLRARRPS